MKKRQSTNDDRHPYMVTSKWSDGTLTFWRDNMYYSKQSVEYFESRLKEWIQKENKFIVK
jgi:hypothetical protein